MIHQPPILAMLPPRVTASFALLNYGLNVESGDDNGKGARDLLDYEAQAHKAAVETIRRFILGEMDCADQPRQPRPDLGRMIEFHKMQAAQLMAMQQSTE